MTRGSQASWMHFGPSLASKATAQAFLSYARAFARLPRDDEHQQAVDRLRSAFIENATCSGRADRPILLAAGLVLADLITQGWELRVRAKRVELRPPLSVSEDLPAEKARIRRQELVKRDAQLREPSVEKFIRSMEGSRVFNGKFTSVFSLMRDGRELAEALRRARSHSNNGWAEALASVVDPYLEFVTSDEALCRFTGLRLMDIWRYFRHNWSNQYMSVPGRTMTFLVRDRAAPFHPIVGIGALSSPVMQIRERDAWIGWHPDTFSADVKANPTDELAHWLVRGLDGAIAEIYVEDLLEDGVLGVRDLADPTDGAICQLLKDADQQRRLHHRYVRSQDHKTARTQVAGPEYWVGKARSHLFRSKRSLALATYLGARVVLKKVFAGDPTAAKLAALAATGQGSEAIRKILRKAKADRIGISVADITVCGAVQPYNAIRGGNLVAMLATSPEGRLEYRRRYSSAESEIASSVAGRPIVRSPTLVLLSTTSLYGVGSSQYNRIKIPCDRLDGSPEEAIRYEELGHSEAFGTSQYGEETVEALVDVVQQSTDGQRVNSIFGEGVSPKPRKVGHGLDLLGLPAELLVRPHRPRVLDGISLARNLRPYLLGITAYPPYFLPVKDGARATASIAAWWRERWLRKRIESDKVLADVGRHTLVSPIRHGARVVVPQRDEQPALFAEPY